MLILDSGCGWIPDAPIKFMYHIINLIKNLTPVILIIMGSLDFGKAVMSQKEDEIKKAQGAFIKKIIAGAAVFFTIVFAKWIVKIVENAGGDSGNAWSCLSALLNDSYEADDKTYYEGPEGNNSNNNNNSNTNNNYYDEECKKTYYMDIEDYKETPDGKDCFKEFNDPLLSSKKKWEGCYIANVTIPYNVCVKEKFDNQISKENNDKAICMQQNNCNDINNCRYCGTTIDKYTYCINQARLETNSCVIDYPYVDNKEEFMEKCKSGNFDQNLSFNDSMNKNTTWNYCYNQYGGSTHNKDKFETELQNCCEQNYQNRLNEKNNCINDFCKNYNTPLVKWYCDLNPDKCS